VNQILVTMVASLVLAGAAAIITGTRQSTSAA